MGRAAPRHAALRERGLHGRWLFATARYCSGDNLYLADIEMINLRQGQPEERKLLGCA